MFPLNNLARKELININIWGVETKINISEPGPRRPR